MPAAVPQCSLPGGATGPVQHGRPVLASLLIEELLLVSRLPVVAGLAVLHSIDVVTFLHVAAALQSDSKYKQELQTSFRLSHLTQSIYTGKYIHSLVLVAPRGRLKQLDKKVCRPKLHFSRICTFDMFFLVLS